MEDTNEQSGKTLYILKHSRRDPSWRDPPVLVATVIEDLKRYLDKYGVTVPAYNSAEWAAYGEAVWYERCPLVGAPTTTASLLIKRLMGEHHILKAFATRGAADKELKKLHDTFGRRATTLPEGGFTTKEEDYDATFFVEDYPIGEPHPIYDRLGDPSWRSSARSHTSAIAPKAKVRTRKSRVGKSKIP